eukprot:scaffold9920_cov70-Cylindrotheca_fusiformis.AAC.1
MQRKETFILTILSLLFVALFVYGALGNNISEPKKTTTTTLDSSFKNNKTLTVGEKRNKSSSSNKKKQDDDDDIIRIVCIGDSLTAGVTSVGNKDWKPYAPYLQAQMEHDLLLSNNSSKNISILHYGYPGWTSAELMHGRNNKNSDNMESILSSATTTSSTESNLSLDLVIIMAGTNDMLRGRYNSYNVSQQVIELHQFCYEHYSVPRSILLEIPGAKAYKRDSDLKKEVNLLSQHMRTFAESESRATFVPFPFDYTDDDGDDKWSMDGVHCTEKGYRALAEYLAPIVQQVLLH